LKVPVGRPEPFRAKVTAWAGGGIRGAGGAGEVGEVHDIHVYGVADDGGIGADDPDFVAARSDGSGDGQRDRTTCTCGGG